MLGGFLAGLGFEVCRLAVGQGSSGFLGFSAQLAGVGLRGTLLKQPTMTVTQRSCTRWTRHPLTTLGLYG